jgi:hypothetical protein
MRLINITICCLEEFIGRNVPKYTILSQTWENEVPARDMVHDPRKIQPVALEQNGKIELTCRSARQAGLGYAWIHAVTRNVTSTEHSCTNLDLLQSSFPLQTLSTCQFILSFD